MNNCPNCERFKKVAEEMTLQLIIIKRELNKTRDLVKRIDNATKDR